MTFRWTSALEAEQSATEPGEPGAGALIISLDFELLWGVRDLLPPDGGAYRANILGAREAIPRMLDLFAEFDVAATWATVGFLFAETRDELEAYRPRALPRYADRRLDPYADEPGANETADPLRYGASLLRRIASVPRQEIASHTYSHYYPLEPGSEIDSFRADLASAVAIARDRGITLKSLVFPRNQYNAAFTPVLRALGFTSCRTNETSWMYRESAGDAYRRIDARAGRLLDSYVSISGPQAPRWSDIEMVDSVRLLPASRFLRPFTPRLAPLEGLRLHRITSALRQAATEHRLFHLWWHPHNFGLDTDRNLLVLRRILESYRECNQRFGMRSLTMADAAAMIRR
jgi:peptidoglycan/xylan/chitin deacetylase (PgdA/CDA1 family)